jgi:hypothetical protein
MKNNRILSHNIRFIWTCTWGIKTNTFFLLETSGKHSPLFLLEQEIFLQFSVRHFLPATNGESLRQTINTHSLFACSSLPYSLRADHTENISSCIVESLLVAAETVLQRRCHERSLRQHRILYRCVSICCRRNAFIVPPPRNDRLFSFHSSDYRRHAIILHLMVTQNNVGYWVLAADTMKLVIT